MLEKDIENLIAQHPEEFFPGENFTRAEQQYRINIPQQQRNKDFKIDILFENTDKRRTIVEVKRGILTREAPVQIHQYYSLLKERDPDVTYKMILCANEIPSGRRPLLQQLGIRFEEISIGRILEIAKKYNYTFEDDGKDASSEKPSLDQMMEATALGGDNTTVWLFQGNPQRYDVVNSLSDTMVGDSIHWLVNQRRGEIKKGHIGLIWISGVDSGIYAITRINNDPKPMIEPEAEKKYWLGSEGEKAEASRVEMTIIRRLINKPIFRTQLLATPGLEELSILRNPRGTNFPVRDMEWQVISKLLDSK